jgi:hypothetical protein
MGGMTTPSMLIPVHRLHLVLISLAGPFAGFTAAGVVYGAMFALVRLVPGVLGLVSEEGLYALNIFLWINLYWGLFNLIPVLPLDGGHVLEHTLGPRRARLTAGLSFLAGAAGAAYFVLSNNIYPALLLGLASIQSLQRFYAKRELSDSAARQSPKPREEPPSGEVTALLLRARQALAEDRLDDAVALANGLLTRDPAPSQSAACEAHEVLGWAGLLGGDLKVAAGELARARKLGDVDPALAGSLHKALGEVKQARKLLEDARAEGDDRKEVVGPLIQILIEQGEVARAAAVALDIVESLSEEDARRMAEIAFEHGAFEWAARLYEAVFRRNGEGEDAYGAARANAKDGNLERALELLQSAVQAGFSDRARAWSDSALESLRNGPLETVLPRP